ncbi:MAG TPA: HlyD family secretion protein [Acetobacteraceae bacterium]
MRIAPILLTLSAVLLAGLCGWWMWNAYVGSPWTRDGTVLAYVITETPEVSGRIVSLPVKADQFVHKGDVLMVIEPTDYSIAVSNAEAVLAKAKASVENSQTEATRRLKLNDLSVSAEEQQIYVTNAQVAQAAYNQALSALAQARVNLERTTLRSPVNGYITNLQAQVGDYATSGQRSLSIVDRDSFWVDGYFLETQLEDIHLNDPAKILLMGHRTWLRGHVVGIARGIEVPNAQADPSGLATVNPVFTWIRLAQRVPVRIAFDEVPPSLTLAVGLTATVEIERTSSEGPPVTDTPATSPADSPPG